MFKNHPSGLKVLFFTEMWERFGYYLMIGILTLYMYNAYEGSETAGGFAMSPAEAASIYGIFIALVYLTPFFGGILADRMLGYRKSVVIGGLLMAAGYFVLGIPNLASHWTGFVEESAAGHAVFFTGLGIIILGNGFFKPNISTIVGRLYPEGSPLKDAGYNIFYMGINIGAFACNFVAALLRNRFGWGYAFAAAGIGMLLGVAIFLLNQRHLRGVSDRGDASVVEEGNILKELAVKVVVPAAIAGWVGWAFLGGIFGTAATAAFVMACVPVVVYYGALWAKAAPEEKGPIGALLAIFAVVIVFWMVFHPTHI